MNGDAAGAPYAEYLERMLVHEPEMRLARAVVPSARAPRAESLHLFDTLLLDAALDVRDAGVALAKLAWWHDEIERARAGTARHPVVLQLGALGAIETGGLGARVAAAAAIAQIESPADDGALFAPFVRFAGASPEATAVDEPVESLAAAILALRVRRWPAFAQPQRARIPLATLAHAGASREAAVSDATPAASAIDALLAPIAARLDRAARAVDVRIVCARHVVRAMRRDPRVAAGGGARARPLPLLWDLWRAARRSRVA